MVILDNKKKQTFNANNWGLMKSGVSRRSVAKWVAKFNFQYLILKLFDSMYPLDE